MRRGKYEKILYAGKYNAFLDMMYSLNFIITRMRLNGVMKIIDFH